ncbi:glycosyl hydrolase [Polyplosphaeria fusca]|uniref:alpha-1,2-Mannosidase n=1 Tax=Polyplosphaeria fusca TaxID=682080 RepID=A0A9P4UTP6_9PLEO|nr:glycosyl hydrolase [Polyplosphaeria fusca]
MYASKRSSSFTRRPRSRSRSRWPTLVLLVFVGLVVVYRWPSTFFPSPRSSRFAAHQTSCPKKPPYPPIEPSPDVGFNWRSIATQHPVKTLAQLPKAWGKKELPRVQYAFEKEPEDLYAELMRGRRQAAVKAAFVRCWESYKERAWMQDELEPISGGSKTTFGGWGATLVDSLDTLWIMDLKSEFEEAVDAVTQIDFRPDGGELNMFETTIRYLGGLLAAYDLTDCKDGRLLEKALELGDMVYASFDTANRMPITRWSSEKASNGDPQYAASNGIIAEMASFSLEFTRLSQITGDMRYYDAVKRVADVLEAQQMETNLPGLWPVGINVAAPNLTESDHFSLGAMADSAYEYLPKTYQLLHGVGHDAAQYKTMFERAASAITQHLLFRPSTPDDADILIPTVVRARSPSTSFQDHTAQHLACFVGGMFALGGKLFSNATHVSLGRRLTDGCTWAYANAPNAIMPEIFTMSACPSLESPCPYREDEHSYQHPGFISVSDARYNLRPEAIESVFYLYRITGDSSYQDTAWDMFQAIDSLTRTEYGNAVLRDVMFGDGSEKEDRMETFWLGETLKYFWLVFSGPSVVSLDEWVLNTEAHPLRVRA